MPHVSSNFRGAPDGHVLAQTHEASHSRSWRPASEPCGFDALAHTRPGGFSDRGSAGVIRAMAAGHTCLRPSAAPGSRCLRRGRSRRLTREVGTVKLEERR